MNLLARRPSPAFVAATLIVSAWTLSPGLAAGPSLDASIFLVVAQRLLAGDVPYLQVWDHKPPGVYVTDALAQLSFFWADDWTAVWLASVLAAAASGVLLAVLCLPRWGWPVAATLGLLATAFLGTYVVSLGGGMSETLSVPWALTALVLVGRAESAVRRWFGAGLAAGVACLVSLQMLPVVMALAMMALLRPDGRTRALAGVAAGGLLVAILTAAGLGVLGALPQAIDQVIGYNAAYRGVGDESAGLVLARVTIPSLATVVLTLMPLIALALNGVIGWRPRSHDGSLVFAAAVWLVGAAAFTLYQGRFYTHYAGAFVPPIALLAAPGAARLWAMARGSTARAFVVGVPFMAMGVLSILVASSTGSRYAEEQLTEWNLAAGVDETMSRSAPDGGSVFVWGNAPDIYLRTTFPPSSRYVYMYPLTTPGYSTAEQVGSVISDFRRAPPQFVVDARLSAEPGSPFAVNAGDGRILDLLDPLRAEIRRQYRPLSRVGPWTIYVLNDS